MCGRHVAGQENHRKSVSDVPESLKSGPKPVSAWATLRKTCSGSGADRQADIYEYLVVLPGPGARLCDPGSQRSCLEPSRDREACWTAITAARSAVSLGEFALEIRQSASTPRAHGALVRECHRRTLSAPWRPGYGQIRNAPIQCTAVRVWKVVCSDAEDKLKWILLCNAEVVGLRAGA